jgi:hypothetical protein
VNAAGWYADPTNQLQLRYWDGTKWSEEVRPLPAPAGDPLEFPEEALGAADASPTVPPTGSRTVLGWAILVGGLMTAGGTLLGWLTATSALVDISRNAFQLGANESLTADGPIVLVLGLATMTFGVALLTSSELPTFLRKYAMFLGLGAAVVLGLEYNSLHNWVKQVGGTYATASIGTGYWICCIGALVSVFVGASVLRTPN